MKIIPLLKGKEKILSLFVLRFKLFNTEMLHVSPQEIVSLQLRF